MAKLQRKRFLAFFLTVLMMVGIFAEMPIHMTVSAATQYVDGNVWSYEEEDGIITITGIEEAGDPSNIIIPAEINGGNVGKIGDYAFSSIYDLTSVTIPAGVTDIGNYAFAYCSNLTSVELPESLTMIGSSAFYDSGLTSITIPDSVTTIESSAFYSCNGLTSVELPESLTAIGSSAFSNCTGLTSITIPASVKTIGSSAFQSTGLTSITIPDSVTAIESSAFYNCSALTSAYFEHGNASEITFGSSVFGSTASGFRIIYDDAAEGFNPNSDGTWNSYPAVSESFAASLNGFAVEGTESYTITGYTGELTEIEIPSAIGEIPVTAIGNSAFSGKSNLTSIIIPDSVTTIGDSAFYNCTGLTSVELPENLTTIGSSVFYGCSGLTSVTIPDSVTTIGSSAFYGCSGLTSVTIPDSVTTIGVNAFNNCTGLTSVTIPNSVTTIGDSAFYYCTALKIASFEHTDASKITSFGYNVFYRAASGFRIEYPDGDDVTGYETDGEKYTWKGFPAYPSSVSAELEKLAGFTYTIDNDGFVINGYNGTETEVEIPPNIGDIKVYRIAQNAFNTYSNGNITSVTIPDTIINIGQEAFFNCNRLTRAYFKHADGNNVRLGQSVFPNTTDFQIIYPEGAVNFADNDYKWNGYTAYPQGFVMPESDFEFQYENGGVTITGYKGEATEIEIPSEIDERPILAIGDRVFSEKYNLKSITIPDSVKTIGNYAFYYCYGLTSIEISENLTAIGEYAFYNCSNLKSVELPESLTTIGNDAFQSCSGLTSITIPANVTAIGDSAFYYCYNLTSANFEHEDASTVTLGSSVFSSTASGFRIIYPDGASGFNTNSDYKWYGYTAYSESAVNDTNGLEFSYDSENEGFTITSYTGDEAEVIIPSEIDEKPVTAIGYRAFYQKYSLTSITIPDSVKTIESQAFHSCTGLTSVELPENLTMIGSEAFRSCSKLTSITIPANVTTIGDSAFRYCNALTSANFEHEDASTVTSFGVNVFSSTKSGFRIVYPDDAAGYVTGDTKYIWKDYTAYPESFENAEKPANFKYTLDNDGVTITGYTGDETEVIIPEEIGGISVYKIGDSAFSGKSKLTSVTIPGSITAIGNSAFNNCDGLTSITIPANVTSIGDSAFYNCDGLTTAYFKHDNGNNVELGQNAFPGTGFQIIYPAGAEKFADNNYNWKGYPAYPDGFVMPESDFTIRYENDGITITGYKGEAAEIEIPSEIDGRPVLKIGDSAFSGKSNLTSVTIPASVTDIGNYAFQSCSGLTSIELPENLTTIGSCAFEYCSGLTSIEIPDGVTTIESYTFDNSGLTSVTIPDSVTTIGSYAFQSCPNLTSVTIPNSVERIGSSAFAYCNNLESAHFEHADASKITLEGYVFGSAASSFRITYPKGAANFEPNHDYKWYGYRAYPADFSVPDVDNGGNLKYPEGEDEIKNFSFIFENSGVTITGYDGEAADVIIPEAIAGRTVLKIAYNAFDSELKNMKSVTIHASITDIASYAFYNCPDLRTVNLLHKDSSAITTLTSTSFARTARGFHLVLTEEFAAALGEGVYTWNEYTAYSSAIDDKIPEDIEISFIDASNAILTAYTGNAEKYTIPETIPDSDIKITQIGASAFEGNKNLVSVTIPASITAIGDYAFRNCSNLKTACLKHDNSESLSLGADVFRGCHRNFYIEYPEGAANFEPDKNYKWNGYRAYPAGFPVPNVDDEGNLKYPESEDKATDFSFVFENGGVTITGYLYNATEINIPDKIEERDVLKIGDYAFYQHTNLRSIKIPETVTAIGNYAFADCYQLRSVSRPDGESGETTIDGGITIPVNVKSIGNGAFRNCRSLVFMEIPASVTDIGYSAFEFCIGLEEVILGESVKTIGNSAFASCAGLTEVKLGESVKTIGSSAFANCTSLKEITIPASVTAIGDYAFYNIPNFRLAKFEHTDASTITMGGQVFANTHKGFRIVYNDGAANFNPNGDYTWGNGYYTWGYFCMYQAYPEWLDVKIPDDLAIAFEKGETGSLTILIRAYTGEDTEVKVPGSIETSEGVFTPIVKIGIQAFENDGDLARVELPDSIITIDNYAFRNCTQLVSINIPSKVETIGDYAFTTCTSLASIEFPESLKTIGVSAFESCTSLASTEFPESLKTIGDYAFTSCTSLTNVNIPKNVETIGAFVFYQCSAMKEITVDEDNEYYAAIDNILYNKDITELIYYPAAKEDDRYAVPKGVKTISQYAFAYCHNLTDLILPDSIETINAFAFPRDYLYSGVPALHVYMNRMDLPSIDYNAFEFSNSNVSIVVPNNYDWNNSYFPYANVIYDGNFVVSDIRRQPNSDITIDISVNNNYGGISSYDFYFEFDAERVEFVSCESLNDVLPAPNAEVVTPEPNAADDERAYGVVLLDTAGEENFYGADLLRLTFKIKDGAKLGTIGYDNFNDPYEFAQLVKNNAFKFKINKVTRRVDYFGGESEHTTLVNPFADQGSIEVLDPETDGKEPTFTVGEAFQKVGGIAYVDVKVENNPGFNRFEFYVDYNPEKLEFANFNYLGIPDEGSNFYLSGEKVYDGRAIVSGWYTGGIANYTGEGRVFTLGMTVKSGAGEEVIQGEDFKLSCNSLNTAQGKKISYYEINQGKITVVPNANPTIQVLPAKGMSGKDTYLEIAITGEQNITEYSFDLQYYGNIEFEEDNHYDKYAIMKPTHDETTGIKTVKVTGNAGSEVSGNGLLTTIKFKVNDGNNNIIYLTNSSMKNGETEVLHNVGNPRSSLSMIPKGNPTIQIGKVKGGVGRYVSVDVWVSSDSNYSEGLSAYQLGIWYDKSKLTFSEAVDSGALMGIETVSESTDKGYISITGAVPTSYLMLGVPANGKLMTLNFLLAEDAKTDEAEGFYAIKVIDSLIFGKAAGHVSNTLHFAERGEVAAVAADSDEITKSPVIKVGNVSGYSGTEIDVEVKFEDNPGIAGYKVNVEYDFNALEYVGITGGNLLSINEKDGVNSSVSGKIVVATYADLTDTANDGVLFTLKFRIKSGSAEFNKVYPIKLTYDKGDILDESKNYVNPQIVNGGVKILVTGIKGDLTGDGRITMSDLITIVRHVVFEEIITEPLVLEAANVNGDETIDIDDVIRILQHIAELKLITSN